MPARNLFPIQDVVAKVAAKYSQTRAILAALRRGTFAALVENRGTAIGFDPITGRLVQARRIHASAFKPMLRALLPIVERSDRFQWTDALKKLFPGYADAKHQELITDKDASGYPLTPGWYRITPLGLRVARLRRNEKTGIADVFVFNDRVVFPRPGPGRPAQPKRSRVAIGRAQLAYARRK